VRQAEADRDAARERYRSAASRRELVEWQIKMDQGADEDLRDAMAAVDAADLDVQKKRAELSRAEGALKSAELAGQNTTQETERRDDAQEALDDAEDAQKSAEEDLEDQRDEHAKIVDDYQEARADELRCAEELSAAEDRVTEAYLDLAKAEADLAKARRRASVRGLDDPPPAEQEEAAP
jgi:chromosome segregation ATPase